MTHHDSCVEQDIVTRHAHVTGHHVIRRFGWDTHGLPVEHEIDKKLGITGRDDVMRMGIDQYNAECRSIVMRYASEWRSTVERMGRWIDFDNDYKTLNPTFMESVWWAFKTLHEKGQVYRGLRVMPYSTGCTTPLSNFEAGLAYKDVNDPAVTVAFPLVDDRTTSLLAWTTTPWTLPSNLALCVHPTFTYVKIHDEERDQNFILHEGLLRTLYKDPKKAKYKKLATFKGSDMKGWRYVPLFEYFTERVRDADASLWHEMCSCRLSSSRIRLSGSSQIPTSRPKMVQASYIKRLLSVKTITVSLSRTASCYRKTCPHVPLTTLAGSIRKSRISLVNTSRYEAICCRIALGDTQWR